MAYNYIISYGPSATGPWTSAGTVTGTTDTISGLASGTNYYFQAITVDTVTGIQSTPVVSGPFSTVASQQLETPEGSVITATSTLQTFYASQTVGQASITGPFDKWTLASGVVYKNGATAAFSSGVTEIYYHNSTVYQYNGANWYGWTGTDWTAVANPVPTSPTLAIGGIPTENTGTPFTVNGTVQAYSAAPTLQYRDNLGTWNSLPAGSSVSTISFSFTHPAVTTANGSFTVSVQDANATSVTATSNTFAVIVPGTTTITGITLKPLTFSSSSLSGTVVGPISVITAGSAFNGTLSVTGTNAADFSISGSNLVLSTMAGQILNSQGPAIVDSYGNKWTIVSTSNGQVAYNGTTDTTTSSVVQLALAYISGQQYIYQYNGSTWYYKAVVQTPVQSPNNWAATNYPPVGLAAGTYSINIVATMTNASGSPFTQGFSLTSKANTTYNGGETTTYTSSGIPIRSARSVIDGIGFNLGYANVSMANRAAAMQYAGSRWMRVEMGKDENNLATGLQAALVAANYNNPNLKVQVLVNGYLAYASALPWTATQAPSILNYVSSWKDANGNSLVHAIEGPNEMNSDDFGCPPGHSANGEQACIVDTTTPVDNNLSNGGQADPNSDAAFIGWTKAMSNWRSANATALKGIELLSPTLNGYYFIPWPNDMNINGLVDYGCYHWYAATPTGDRANNGNNITVKEIKAAAAQAMFGNSSASNMVISEGPIYQPGMNNDLVAMARGNIMALMDFFAANGHRCMFFELNVDPNNNNQTTYGFGVVTGSDGVSILPSGHCLHNLTMLLSLNKNYSDPVNNSDTQAFTAAYDPTNFSVSGIDYTGDAGSSLIMPKSDGTTMIAVWNEPNILNGTPTANNVTVNLGTSHTYNVYDVSGSGGAATMNAQASTTPYASGTGSTINITLYGIPVLIELTN